MNVNGKMENWFKENCFSEMEIYSLELGFSMEN